MFIKAINNILQLSRGMPKLNSVCLVGDCLYSQMAEKGSSRLSVKPERNRTKKGLRGA